MPDKVEDWPILSRLDPAAVRALESKLDEVEARLRASNPEIKLTRSKAWFKSGQNAPKFTREELRQVLGNEPSDFDVKYRRKMGCEEVYEIFVEDDAYAQPFDDSRRAVEKTLKDVLGNELIDESQSSNKMSNFRGVDIHVNQHWIASLLPIQENSLFYRGSRETFIKYHGDPADPKNHPVFPT